MKKVIWILVSLCLAMGSSVAQRHPAAVGNRPTDSQIVDFILNFQEKRLLEVAESMPAERYGFAPSQGTFEGVRTFGEQLRHIAADNYMLGAGILGEQPPVDVGSGENGARNVTTKPEIIAYLKNSFAYMHRAAAIIDAANTPIATPSISPWPSGMATRLGVAIEDCVHTWDHYGQLAEYLRMNNIVPPQSGRSNGQTQDPPSAGKNVSQALDFWIGVTEKELVATADAMPEEKYGFAPTASGFEGVRTFAQQIKHLAANNYRMAAYIVGQKPTPDQESETGPETVRTKSEVMEYLRGSFTDLHRAVGTINEGNMVETLQAGPSARQRTRLQLAVDVVAHSYDHYGQMVEYLRMNGIIPPSSRK